MRPKYFKISARALLSLSVIILASNFAHATDRTIELTFVVFSDIYEMSEKSGRGGFARVSATLASERYKHKNILVAFAGDTLSPSLMSNLDRGAHIVDLMNQLNPDIFVPGNHEFDFGENIFRTRMREINSILLAANLRDNINNPISGFLDSKIIEKEGVKIGIFGLTEDDASKHANTGDLKISPAIETAILQANLLRDAGADIIVAVTHSDMQDDFQLSKLGVIDVVLSGHDHNLLTAYDGRTAIAETQADGVNIVAIDLTITLGSEPSRKISWTPKFRIIDTADVIPDPRIVERIAHYQTIVEKELNQTIGVVEHRLDSRKVSVRNEETAIGNYIADVMRKTSGADVALINGGAIRGNQLYQPGQKLSLKDIITELPFDNKTVVLEISGANLRKALENAISLTGKDSGRFGQISGLRIIIAKEPQGDIKLLSAEINGKPLEDARSYKLATTDFLASGKDGYDILVQCKRIVSDVEGPLLSTLIIDDIKKSGALTSVIDGRIVKSQ